MNFWTNERLNHAAEEWRLKCQTICFVCEKNMQMAQQRRTEGVLSNFMLTIMLMFLWSAYQSGKNNDTLCILDLIKHL